METDDLMAGYLRSVREIPEEEVVRLELAHDVERGPYVAAGLIVHHQPDESRH